jgi:RimJ/RimL family protein N-acetyltransferase
VSFDANEFSWIGRISSPVDVVLTTPSSDLASSEVVLATPRLLMRPLTRDYVADLLDLYADPGVARFLTPLDEAGHLQRCLEAEEAWVSRGYGRAAFHDRASGRFVGRGGLQYWPQFDEVEVTWALRRDSWGQGLATEAGGAWMRWGLENLDVPYITALIAPENTGSLAVAERLGMSVLRTDTQHARQVLVYALSCDERRPAVVES